MKPKSVNWMVAVPEPSGAFNYSGARDVSGAIKVEDGENGAAGFAEGIGLLSGREDGVRTVEGRAALCERGKREQQETCEAHQGAAMSVHKDYVSIHRREAIAGFLEWSWGLGSRQYCFFTRSIPRLQPG